MRLLPVTDVILNDRLKFPKESVILDRYYEMYRMRAKYLQRHLTSSTYRYQRMMKINVEMCTKKMAGQPLESEQKNMEDAYTDDCAFCKQDDK